MYIISVAGAGEVMPSSYADDIRHIHRVCQRCKARRAQALAEVADVQRDSPSLHSSEGWVSRSFEYC